MPLCCKCVLKKMFAERGISVFGMATISRLLKIIGLFCKRGL